MRDYSDKRCTAVLTHSQFCMNELQATDDMPHVMTVGHESYPHMDSTYKGAS